MKHPKPSNVAFIASNVHQGHYVYVNNEETDIIINLFAYETNKDYKDEIDNKIQTVIK